MTNSHISDDDWNDSSDVGWCDTIRVAWVLDINITDRRTFDEHTARSYLRRIADQLTRSDWTVQPVRVDVDGYPYLHRA